MERIDERGARQEDQKVLKGSGRSLFPYLKNNCFFGEKSVTSQRGSILENRLLKRMLFLVKILITLLILWIIFRRIEFQEVSAAALQIKLRIIILLVMITVLKFITQYKNWEQCLKITSGYKPAKYEILKSHFIGQALRFIIPGGHATFAKVYFVTNRKKATLFSVGIERFMQTWTNLWFASWAGFFYFKQYSLFLRLGGVILITLIPLLVYWSSRILKRPSWKEYFKQYLKIVPAITLRQMFFVFLTVLQYFIIINQFFPAAFGNILITVPLILVANLIPVTYAGLGLRETFAIHLLRNYQIQPEFAVTASLLIFILNSVVPALIGAVLLALSGRKKTVKG